MHYRVFFDVQRREVSLDVPAKQFRDAREAFMQRVDEFALSSVMYLGVDIFGNDEATIQIASESLVLIQFYDGAPLEILFAQSFYMSVKSPRVDVMQILIAHCTTEHLTAVLDDDLNRLIGQLPLRTFHLPHAFLWTRVSMQYRT
jgi:hypothetical protein